MTNNSPERIQTPVISVMCSYLLIINTEKGIKGLEDKNLAGRVGLVFKDLCFG